MNSHEKQILDENKQLKDFAAILLWGYNDERLDYYDESYEGDSLNNGKCWVILSRSTI